jgi:hypothetical protein
MLPRYSHTTPSRTTLATLLFAGLLATTGCLGFITGNNALTATSTDVAVSDSALSATDYEPIKQKTISVNETVSVADQERTVKATSHLRVYSRDVPIQVNDVTLPADVAVTRFAVLSTPKAQVAGESLNPIGHLSEEELVKRFLQEYNEINELEFVGNRTVSSLGDKRTVSTFSATVQITENVEIPILFHVTTFAHNDDYITAIAIHPEQIDEEKRIERLLNGLEHPA